MPVGLKSVTLNTGVVSVKSVMMQCGKRLVNIVSGWLHGEKRIGKRKPPPLLPAHISLGKRTVTRRDFPSNCSLLLTIQFA